MKKRRKNDISIMMGFKCTRARVQAWAREIGKTGVERDSKGE
jgi:hypothetical protein